jgi:hypothetical protein
MLGGTPRAVGQFIKFTDLDEDAFRVISVRWRLDSAPAFNLPTPPAQIMQGHPFNSRSSFGFEFKSLFFGQILNPMLSRKVLHK